MHLGKLRYVIAEIAQQYILPKLLQPLPCIPRQPVFHYFLLIFHLLKINQSSEFGLTPAFPSLSHLKIHCAFWYLWKDHALALIVGVRKKRKFNIPCMSTEISQRITINPDICHGKPTIRVLVEMILELIAGGMTSTEIPEDYPDLREKDILACLEYAAKLTQINSIYRIAV